MDIAPTDHRRYRSRAGLLGWLALTALAGAVGAAASIQAASIYQSLDRPAWAPPSWIFGPVWTALYVMMAVAAWMVWRELGWQRAKTALVLYCVQLVANAAWSWLFFAWRQGALSFAEIVVLWILVLGTTIAFFRFRRAAGYLMLPYLAWVAFAAVLNYAIWQRNVSMLA